MAAFDASHIWSEDGMSLLVVGDGAARYPTLEKVVREKRLTDRVHFLTGLSDEELCAAYRKARYVIIPSLYEGFGFPAIEAMACGTPILSNNGGALAEVVDSAGLVENSTESLIRAMRELCTNQSLRTKLRTVGLSRATHFSWRKAAKSILLAYQVAYERSTHHTDQSDVITSAPKDLARIRAA